MLKRLWGRTVSGRRGYDPLPGGHPVGLPGAINGQRRRARGTKRSAEMPARSPAQTKKVRFTPRNEVNIYMNLRFSREAVRGFLDTAIGRAGEINAVDDQALRARRLTRLLTNVVRSLFSTVLADDPLAPAQDRKLVLLALLHHQDLLEQAASDGDTGGFQQALATIQRELPDGNSLPAYWKIKVLELAVVHIIGNCQLLHPKRPVDAREQSTALLECLCDGRPGLAPSLGRLTAELDRDGDLDRVCREARRLITQVAENIHRIGADVA
jgi:hypothetical protein